MKKVLLMAAACCLLLTGCGNDKKISEYQDKTKELIAVAKTKFQTSIMEGNGVINTMQASDLDVEEKPTAGVINFTPNLGSSDPIITASGIEFGKYTCDYNNDTAVCVKKK